MNESILLAIDDTTRELLDAIAQFSDDQFNKVPFVGSWTAGQVAEHLLKAESGIPVLWGGKNKRTERAVDEYVATIRSIFLDYTTKLRSPEFIVPSDLPKVKTEMYGQLKSNRSTIRAMAEQIDLTLTYTKFPFPNMGELTGIEWATFIICHSRRHIRQLKNINHELNQV